ncbi:glycosyltransferase [Agromyces sp. Leaf222]|uniref:glycosyltransferase n=1 Tax=Agromyces sp. Leaf222 TaxID=1735688 RepID=UPI0006F380E9|nr:glycosyltransferase [Agromyces sp. Leaf222]KQM83897.1 glycosyl transferase [Agromyces sp. Leaf222]
MKVALLAESFLPHMNGVTHSLLQVLRHLERRGHDALVIAPRSGPVEGSPLASPDGSRDDAPGARLHGARTVLLPSMPLPTYPDVRVTLAGAHRLATLLREHDADVVHLASPFVLGWRGILAAEALGMPTVAVYQTDIPSYAERYGVPGAAPALARHMAKLHQRATITLAPSGSAVDRLTSLDVDPHRIALWRRGVDTDRFSPSRRTQAWRRDVAGVTGDEVVVGYVGRLAPEKQVEDLRAIADLPRTRLVIVGDGPSRAMLERMLPTAVFTGFLGGDALAEAMACFDVFVHPGESETFCQTIQEALASGVPVVATGRGGPLDLVENSVDGWLYRPGDLAGFRDRVRDLVGDDAKRRAFAVRAREAVHGRGWDVLGDELLGHYERVAAGAGRTPAPAAGAAIRHRAPAATRDPAPVSTRERGPAASAPPVPPRWLRYVAVGDSLSEGLCDTSRMAAGEFRGWADRLAMLLALASPAGDRVSYANLAVRSRKVDDVVESQLPQATALGADLVSVLIGANDLVGARPAVHALADRLAASVAAVRGTGVDVLLVTPFMPQRPASRLYEARFAAFADRVVGIGHDTGAIVLDVAALPTLTVRGMWAEDRVHLNSAGHRALAYEAARRLGVPDAAALGALEQAAHGRGVDADPFAGDRHVGDAAWLVRHAAPWVARRLRGRTAGDGRDAKRPELRPVLEAAHATSAVHG